MFMYTMFHKCDSEWYIFIGLLHKNKDNFFIKENCLIVYHITPHTPYHISKGDTPLHSCYYLGLDNYNLVCKENNPLFAKEKNYVLDICPTPP